MSFISLGFSLFVIVTLLVYYIVPKKLQWIVLLIASYVFYLFTGVRYLGYILFTTITTYAAALLIEDEAEKQRAYLKENKETITKEEKKEYKATVKRKQKWLLFCCLLLNFGILLYLKYVDLSIAYINLFRLEHFGRTDFIPFKNPLLPLGISFYTFQAMGYLIDIYYGRYEASKSIFRFALYVSFFPQIIQGPISRFNELMPEFYKERSFEFDRIKSGFYRVMWGLFKKLVIADRLASYVNKTMAMQDHYRGLYIILVIFFYSMQIYGDFSGGIDVALGVGEMFGIRITENFERPFFSKSIAEYWRRWHITLGTWFKDYIFYPLSIYKPVLNLGKSVKTHVSNGLGKRIPLYLPMFIVWFTTGMWHGSQNKYLVWGLLNCFFIILGTELEPVSLKLIEKFRINVSGFVFRAYRAVKTFWLMAFLRVFDISKDVREGFHAIRYAFSGWSSFSFDTVFNELDLPLEEFRVAILAIIILFAVELLQRSGSVRTRIFRLPVAATCKKLFRTRST